MDEAAGSGRVVDDFSTFCEGDVEPTLKKRIHTLIDAAGEYIVYLDDDNAVEWSFTPAVASLDGFGETANRVALLETLSAPQLRPEQIEPFRRLLGEAIARVLGDGNALRAEAFLQEAAEYLQQRGAENARTWYLTGASLVAVPSLLALAIAWLLRDYLSAALEPPALHVALGVLVGATGAWLSILFRTQKITIDPAAGIFIHRLEGAARISVGLIGALFVALGIKAHFLQGILRDGDRSLPALLACCMLAGISERLLPSLISKMEGSGHSTEADVQRKSSSARLSSQTKPPSAANR